MHTLLCFLLSLTVISQPSLLEVKPNTEVEQDLKIKLVTDGIVDTSVISGPVLIPADSIHPDDIEISGDAKIAGTVQGEITLNSGLLYLPGVVEEHVVLSAATFLITGTVGGDLVTIQGEGVLAGEVDGDVLLFGGLIQLDSTALIKGDLTIVGGEVIEHSGAVIRGRKTEIRVCGVLGSILERFLLRRWEKGEKGSLLGLSPSLSRILNGLVNLGCLVFFYLLGMLFLAIIRRWHHRSETLIERVPWRMVLTGVIYVLVMFGIFAILAISVIGWILLPFLVLGSIFIELMAIGQAALWAGKLVKKWFKLETKSSIGIYTLGFLALYALSILAVLFSALGAWAQIPGRILGVLGFLIGFVVGTTIGRGGVIYTLFFSRQTRSILTQEDDESEKT
ncbi:polymer-forming cytoskeletal protein [candidate division WOR-3 bacterium]|nr:polymer-forming cytoskeletal protein [candidate division WOR-3 bacterium]